MRRKKKGHKPYRQGFHHSLHFALLGIAYALRAERNIRLQAVAFVGVMALALFARVSPFEIAVLILAAIGVVMMEIINSAIEALADAVHPQYHPGVKVAKDMAAGAVLVMSLGAVVIGSLIIGPALLALLAKMA